jgi:hypothetical protein
MRSDWFSCFGQKGSADRGGNRRRNIDYRVSGERGMDERPPIIVVDGDRNLYTIVND